jgi:hypothetical protein
MWALPVGVVLLLIFEAMRKADASELPHAPSGGNVKTTRAKGATTPKLHRGFYPPAGAVVVADDASWSWDGGQWLQNGKPAFPMGMLLVGTPGGPIEGWAYDWNLDAWHEPGFIHKDFYPPAGSVVVKNSSAWKWDGQQWLKNGKPDFPSKLPLVGAAGGPLEGWTYDWTLHIWAEPGAVAELIAHKDDIIKSSTITQRSLDAASPVPPTAKAPNSAAPKSSTIKVSSVPQSYQGLTDSDKKTSVIREISSLQQNPDPHPAEISRVAVLASDAGLHQTAATLADKAQQKASSISVSTQSDSPSSRISVTSVPPSLSNAQRVTDLEASLHALENASKPPAQSGPETHPAPVMVFEPEIITRTPDSGITFEPDLVLSRLASPLPGVNDNEWTAFVSSMETIGNKVSDKWELGLWKIGARRLQDLGMAKDARQVDRDGKSVWIADFVPPLSMQIFVNDEHLQYDTFTKEMQYLLKGITDRGMSGKIPTDIHGTFPTTSGLLAVAKIAGFQGLDSFMKPNSRDWDKFPATRDAFLKFNGMF